MTKLLLSVHVLAAILAIGPIAVAASLFPRLVRTSAPGDGGPALLHRICRAYTAVGVVVPAFGVATGARLGVLTDAWLLASIALTILAAGVLAMGILPGQRRLLPAEGVPGPDTPDGAATDGAATDNAATVRLAMLTGVFNLLWAIVVVLMIVRPGSTTGV